MNPHLLMIKGVISEMTEEEQAQVKAAKAELDSCIKKYGEPGILALTLVCHEQGEAL